MFKFYSFNLGKFIICLVIITVLLSCNSKKVPDVVIKPPSMQCKKCKINIESALYKVKGVEFVHVSFKDKIAEINFDSSKTNISSLENKITYIGYVANDKKADSVAYEFLDDCCKLPKDQKQKHTKD